MVRTNAYLCAHPSYAPSELSHNGADSWGSAALHPRLWLFRAFGAGVISPRSIPGFQCLMPSALVSSYHISRRTSAKGAKDLSLGTCRI